MASTIFKPLFSVRFLHGHHLDFLAPKSAPDMFHKLAAADRDDLLADLLARSQYNLLGDLDVSPDAATETLLKDLRMKLAKQADRVLVGMEVERTQPGLDQFRPKRPLADGTKWTFHLRPRNIDWPQFTNQSLRPTLPGIALFTNADAAAAGRVSPSLAAAAPVFSSSKTWEMGELARLNGGADLCFALKQTSLAADFSAPLSTDFHWASSADRVVLPKQFRYRFDPLVKPVSEVIFTLTDAANTVVKTIKKTVAAGELPPDDHLIDFNLRDEKDPADPTHFLKIPDGSYTLTANINGADFETRAIQLRSFPQGAAGLFGILEIQHGPGLAAGFELFGAGNVLLRPVFEIRLMSRPTWWLYQFKKDNPAPPVIGDVELAPGFGDPRMLSAKAVRHLTKAPQKVVYDTTSSPTRVPYLPNPPDFRLEAADGRLWSPIQVSIPLS